MSTPTPNTRKYAYLRGCDFSDNEVKIYRSPNCLNMWKVNDCIETRPGMSLLGSFELPIYGLYSYDINIAGVLSTIVIVHCGTKLYKWNNYPTAPVFTEGSETVTTLFTGMNLINSEAFIWNNVFFIKDGINYLEYNGTTCTQVVGTIPITSTNRTPFGANHNDGTGDTVYQDVNLLQPKRINRFVADGISSSFYLGTKDLDESSVYLMTAVIDGITKIEGIDFTVDRTLGIVSFTTIPPKPSTDGTNNVEITLSKTIDGYANRIKKCTILSEFDSRYFFAGNIDYPNVLFHSELEDPRYVRDTARYEEGLDLAPIKAIIPGNSALWVCKEGNQNNTSVFYHTPTIDSTYGKIYPRQVSNISTGCNSKGINFSDDIVFFSPYGMESITGNLNSEKLLTHRSTLIDKKLSSESNVSSLNLVEYKSYLLVLVNSHVYLADYNQTYTNTNNLDIEYEWYYWELPNSITFIKNINGELFMGNALGNIYKLTGTTDNTTAITSKWTTPNDNFGSDTLLKTTNKRGGTADVKIVEDGTVTVKALKDKGTFETIGTYTTSKGYIVYNIKLKKFKEVQIEFSSSNFGLYSATLQAYLGGFIKR